MIAVAFVKLKKALGVERKWPRRHSAHCRGRACDASLAYFPILPARTYCKSNGRCDWDGPRGNMEDVEFQTRHLWNSKSYISRAPVLTDKSQPRFPKPPCLPVDAQNTETKASRRSPIRTLPNQHPTAVISLALYTRSIAPTLSVSSASAER
jgi:hypothetical protein